MEKEKNASALFPRSVSLFQWSRRDLNPRPGKAPIRFLHAYRLFIVGKEPVKRCQLSSVFPLVSQALRDETPAISTVRCPGGKTAENNSPGTKGKVNRLD